MKNNRYHLQFSDWIEYDLEVLAVAVGVRDISTLDNHQKNYVDQLKAEIVEQFKVNKEEEIPFG